MDSVQRRMETAKNRSDAARRAHQTRRRRYGIEVVSGGRPAVFPHLAEAVLHGAYAKHVFVRAMRGRTVPGWEDIVYWAAKEAAHHARLHLETEHVA